MKQFTKLLILLVVLLMSPLAVQSQRLTPSYLSEMPAPSRVVNEIKGKDAANNGERQMATFAVLIKIMNDMAYGLEHRSERQLTPDEQRISKLYEAAYMDVWQKVKATYGKQYSGEYNNDRDLLVEVLDKFFSENFRTKYLSVNGFAAGWYRKVHANGPTSGTESSSKNSSSPNTPNPGSAAGTDPSIAKARAAHVDTKVYGLQLGEPLRLPTCASAYGEIPATCFYEGEQDAFSKELNTTLAAMMGVRDSKSNEDWRMVFVRSGPKAMVLLHEGLLVAVRIETGGIKDEQQKSTELREKYGAPTMVHPFTYTPRVGNTLKANDLEWRLPGVHVEYSAVLKKPNSSEVVSIDAGSIYVETETAYQRRMAQMREQEKSRTKM